MEHERRTQDAALDFVLRWSLSSVCPLFSRSSVADSAVFFLSYPLRLMLKKLYAALCPLPALLL